MTSTAACRTRCEQCSGPLPLLARADARFCGATCRKRASRARLAAERRRVEAEQVARIPAELRSRARWVRYSSRKVPLRVDGRFAAVNNPATWSDFAAAAAATCGQGFGYVLAAGDDVTVIDLDDAVENGRVLPWAQRIVGALPATYTERGRSGRGLHLWFRGRVPHGRRVRRGEVKVEVYCDRRYIIVGDRVPGTPLELSDLPEGALEALV
ncbi:bifunctional DNA primase/polymerase [Streptomyces sp. SAJ15]|uniref:bifunctional DNA primase/polymerase n=1 Tax=Streptomyces sp. SAJ15 TaxID=2011095 RepID=UPI001185DB65|nr:bifunctional DNA primase/polymerase [Streptomyces sp. SAJ15]TVL89749.1 DNA primase [Streptomyces sp. SAJ15]